MITKKKSEHQAFYEWLDKLRAEQERDCNKKKDEFQEHLEKIIYHLDYLGGLRPDIEVFTGIKQILLHFYK
ncbi:MAG: hypothetical protein HRU40_20780 [Saprospiraceae bacterium]|nr:hypothetical protein [Saprospiraceae bacterium]